MVTNYCNTVYFIFILHSDVAASGIPDEFKLCERIQKKCEHMILMLFYSLLTFSSLLLTVVLQHKERDALRFTELHRRLKSQVYGMHDHV